MTANNLYQVIEKDRKGEIGALLVSFKDFVVKGDIQDKLIKVIRIEKPGTTEIVERPLTEEDKNGRFRRQWQAFCEKGENCLLGIPLQDTNLFNIDQIQFMESIKLYTVEQLSEVSDSLCQKYAELRDYRKRAIELLNVKDTGTKLKHLESENAILKESLSELQKELTSLRELIGSSKEALHDEEKRLAKENKISVSSKSKKSK